MNCICNNLFASTGLTNEKNRTGKRCNPRYMVHNFSESKLASYNLLPKGFSEFFLKILAVICKKFVQYHELEVSPTICEGNSNWFIHKRPEPGMIFSISALPYCASDKGTKKFSFYNEPPDDYGRVRPTVFLCNESYNFILKYIIHHSYPGIFNC